MTRFIFKILIVSLLISCSKRVIHYDNRIEIILPEKPGRTSYIAAKELKHYLSKLELGTPEIVEVPTHKNSLKIRLINQRSLNKFNIDFIELDYGGYFISSNNKDILLAGKDDDFTPIQPYGESREDMGRATALMDVLTNEKWENVHASDFKAYNKSLKIWEQDQRGTLNAVYGFLEILGYRWYAPGLMGEVMPKTSKPNIPELNKYFKPKFEVRNFGFSGMRFFQTSDEDIKWILKLKLNNASSLIGNGPLGHGTRVIHSRPEVRLKKPLIFGEYKGKRDIDSREVGKPCLSSRDLMADNVNYARFMFDHYHESCVSVMPTDAYTELCECNLCKGKDTPERGFNGRISDYVWSYVNSVATELNRTHPDKKVICFAYGAYLLPPHKITNLSPNIIVGICRNRTDMLDPVKAELYQNIIQEWSKLTNNKLIMWDYYLHHREKEATSTFPVTFPMLINNDLNNLETKIYGEFIEIFRNSSGFITDTTTLATNHINVYFTAKRYWENQENYIALLDEYFINYYGAAYDQMKNFFQLAEKEWRNINEKPLIIQQLFDLLSESQRVVKTNKLVSARIQLIENQMKPLKRFSNPSKRADTSSKNVRILRKNSKDLMFDGRLEDTAWKELFSYKIGNGSPVPTFKLAWLSDTLIIGYNHPLDAKVRPLKCLIELETSDETKYRITIQQNGQNSITDFQSNILNIRAEIKSFTSSNAWSYEIKLPIINDRLAAQERKIFYGKWPESTFPWYFNISYQEGDKFVKYFENPKHPNEISMNLVEAIIR